MLTTAPTPPSPQVGRGAARNVDADGRLITSEGVHGCANLPTNEWSDEMDGPVRLMTSDDL